MSEATSNYLDYEVHSTRTSSARLERFSQLCSEALLGLHRYLKIILLHEPGNSAVAQTLEDSYENIKALSEFVGGRVAFTFVRGTIFVAGEPLKASRKVYEAAMDLAEVLRRCGASELSFEEGVEKKNLMALAEPFRRASSRAGAGGLLAEIDIPQIEFREVDALLEGKMDDEGQPLQERVVNLYATGLVVTRRYYNAVARGKSPPPTQIKRIAQRLVTLCEGGTSTLVGMTAMAQAHRDDAGRALQCAILSVAMARQLTQEPITLSRIAMAAMLADVGRTVLLGEEKQNKLVPLDLKNNLRVPMATAAMCIASGGINRAAATRVTTTYEVTWMEREAQLGPLYAETEKALFPARILLVVRALLDRLAPRSTERAMTPTEALQDVLRLPFVDPVLRKMLLATLGMLPAGTVVELSDGHWAVVLGPSTNPRAVSSPRVRVVSDGAGNPLEMPFEIDLGAPPEGRAVPTVSRIVQHDAQAS